ncbi:hypothetical protein TUM22923_15590 [Polynucleobacter sp. TUM22923]|nr:hypothetical protein [Polynucleobacter sp. TUM22923]BDX22238.1 hypothetical protein TUM22923_15590 [Polynucleobacter sp. TUM22923]
MKTKFDLKEDIAKIWAVKDQVDMLYRWHGDGYLYGGFVRIS